MDKLNFNRFSKNELIGTFPEEKCCRTAWLSAAVKAVGSLRLIKGRTELFFETPDFDYVKTLVAAIKSLYLTELDIDISNVNTGLQKGKLYTLRVPSGVTDSVLHDTGIVYDTKGGYAFTKGIPKDIVSRTCCSKSYLKSTYIAQGAAGVPVKIIGEDEDISSSGSGYYLEFALGDELLAESLTSLLNGFDIFAKTVERGNKYVVYVKDSDTISDFFALLSASETVLYMQDIMVERMLNNNVNRHTNCEVANMDKIAIASTKQIIAINAIDEYYGLSRLTPELQALAKLRLDNPEAPLDFFAGELGVTKSCINHRFRKLLSLAEEYKPSDAPKEE